MSPARLLASCFGLGRLRPAPGTFGALLGLGLYALLLSDLPVLPRALVIATVTGIGVAVASASGRELGREDPSEVVIDELAGVWVSMWGTHGWPGWITAFVLFRFFDIVKPFPVRALERLPGGWGVMADDLAAGAYAWGGTWLLLRWIA